MKQKIVYVAVIFAIALSAHVGLPRPALLQESFFQHKTITIIQGRDPGGSGELGVRALVPVHEKYIPGNPRIVMEFMPGEEQRERGCSGNAA